MKQLQKKDIERVADKTLLEANVNASAVMADDEPVLICRGVGIKTIDIEWQADKFAVYLLMPKSFVENAIRSFASPMFESDIRRLAAEFCVSKQAMCIRLVKELKLLYPVAGLYYRSETEFLELGGQQKLF